MMRFVIALLAVSAVLAQDDGSSLVDAFLDTEMGAMLPCTPKTCKPVCKLVTKYVQYGAYKLPYQENVCAPDKKCLADAAACIAKAKLANAAKATHAQKAAAAAAKKKEEAAAASAMAAAKAQFEAAEKAAAAANAAKVASARTAASKAAAMAKALQKFEAAKKLHLTAQAAYAGSKSAAAKALADYNAAVKAHCDAEALHAKAVTTIGHGHMAKSTCAKPKPAPKPKPKPKPKPVVKTKYTHWRGGNGGGARSGRCPGNSYINYWTIRSGTLVDNIRGRCSNGSWLTSCGGGGGGSWTGKADTRRIFVRSGSLIDKFNNRGGNGGGGGWLDCGSGYKITGYDVRCGSLVDKVRFQCKNVR